MYAKVVISMEVALWRYSHAVLVVKAKTFLSRNCRKLHFGGSKLSVFSKTEFKKNVFIL